MAASVGLPIAEGVLFGGSPSLLCLSASVVESIAFDESAVTLLTTRFDGDLTAHSLARANMSSAAV
jgi:hypothetical protein